LGEEGRLRIRAVFFDQDDTPLKEARLTDIRDVDGVPMAHRIEMTSLLEARHTVLSFRELRINQGLTPELFNEEALQRSEN
jgi:hypothetical protein